MAYTRQSWKLGSRQSLIACFQYFDTGFMIWVLYGPLVPFITRSMVMTAAEQGLLVSVPVLTTAILRVAFGNLYQAADGRPIALLESRCRRRVRSFFHWFPKCPRTHCCSCSGYF